MDYLKVKKKNNYNNLFLKNLNLINYLKFNNEQAMRATSNKHRITFLAHLL